MTDKFTSLFGIPKKNENIEKDIEEGKGEESTSMLKSIKSSVEKSVEVEISYSYFFFFF